MATTTCNVGSAEKQVSSCVSAYLVKDALHMSLRPIERSRIMGDGADMALEYAENTWFEAENSYSMGLDEKYDRGLCDEHGFEYYRGGYATNASVEKFSKSRKLRKPIKLDGKDFEKRTKDYIKSKRKAEATSNRKKENETEYKLVCQYCGKLTEKVSGRDIYRTYENLFDLTYYLCKNCFAYVGTDPKTKKPHGEVANMELRTARQKVHSAFDVMWESGDMTRDEAYTWLADVLKIERDECHIAKFSLETCNKIVKLCSKYIRK